MVLHWQLTPLPPLGDHFHGITMNAMTFWDGQCIVGTAMGVCEANKLSDEIWRL
ncbi:hypothetical protein SCLCIDRAFT_1208029 [Scleroderma citrinum Foug A]|uniref:Uncharacterized protein n=1 Tax=Scleroderma citrinum Foug A TaxID=1036808 RepID=A0A0C3EMZ8_9AGAM|nr:hypothetical protein SCLCIDRAFT_1208029 [Scleroderma citrinum Foug A]